MMMIMIIMMISFYSSGVFNEPESYGGKIIGVATEFITIDQCCDAMNKVLAPKVFKVGREFYDLTTSNCRLTSFNKKYRLCVRRGNSLNIFQVIQNFVFQDSGQTADQMAKLGFPGAEEMASMFRLYQKGIERDIALTKKLNPKAKSWEQFVVAHKADFESIL